MTNKEAMMDMLHMAYMQPTKEIEVDHEKEWITYHAYHLYDDPIVHDDKLLEQWKAKAVAKGYVIYYNTYDDHMMLTPRQYTIMLAAEAFGYETYDIIEPTDETKCKYIQKHLL